MTHASNATRTIRLKRFEFPKYWEEIIEAVESSDQVVARMKQLLAEFDLKDAEGITFFLEDESGQELEVHCSHDEWAIAFFPKDGKPVISAGNKQARGTKPFLIPEWTEVERRHLISA